MNNKKCQRGITLLCVLSYLLTSCTTLEGRPVPAPGTPQTQTIAQVGNRVVVTTKAGETKAFKVTAVEPDALVGKNVRIAYADMSTLSVKRAKARQTVITVLAIVLVIAIAGTAIASHEENKVIKDVLTP